MKVLPSSFREEYPLLQGGVRLLSLLGRCLLWGVLGLLGLLLLTLLAFVIYYNVAVDIKDPAQVQLPAIATAPVRKMEAPGNPAKEYAQLGPNWLSHNSDGLWEMYLQGDPLSRGVAFGRLGQSLLYYQESVFMHQIDVLVPNRSYQHFLKYLIRFYNRNITHYIPEENLEEIYGMSRSCSSQFNYVGQPYERQLNFHSAHDLGHAMQDYMLVGCTSFAAWGNHTVNHDLLVGRNFDFYVGDDFAKNKLVTFVRPSRGYPFAMVGWAGMTGVCSGMNKAGLTVTINAAKSSMPTSSATPISILARQILQYAGNIQQALAIARSAQTFVSESILIGSAADGRAAIIEKSVTRTALYEAPAGQQYVACANHYQSKAFASDSINLQNIRTSDSPYRLQRCTQLLQQYFPLNPSRAVSVLRNPYGMDDRSVGLGNEATLNQFIGHHSVVFAPARQLMWVSTSPWQMGKFVCYDLNRIFAARQLLPSVASNVLSLPADSAFIRSRSFQNFLQFRHQQPYIDSCRSLSLTQIADFVRLNPDYYRTWEVAGDASLHNGNPSLAQHCWQRALHCMVPKQMDRERVSLKLYHLLP